jgi:hypothetical protein
MRLQNDKYVCTLCGVQIDVTANEQPLVLVTAATGEPKRIP